jgi:ParB family chromosome partitioning protein
MTENELKKIEEEISLLEVEGKKLSVPNKMKLKKLQRARDKAKSPIEVSSVFVPNRGMQEDIRLIEIDKIIMPDFNDRTGIDNKKIIELAESIKENGLIQPIILIENDNGTYTKIAGRRRILASKRNGDTKIEAIVKKEKLDKKKFNLLVLHENTQREDLSSYDKVRSVLHFIEQEFMVDQIEAKKICHKVNNFNKGNLVKEDLELESISKGLNQILSQTKVFSSVAHLIKHLPVLDMSLDILSLLESNRITFGMALIFNQYSNSRFINQEDFSSVTQHILNEEMSLKDAKAYFMEMLYKSKKIEEKNVTKEIKRKLSKLSKIIISLKEEKQMSFNNELEELLVKYHA